MQAALQQGLPKAKPLRPLPGVARSGRLDGSQRHVADMGDNADTEQVGRCSGTAAWSTAPLAVHPPAGSPGRWRLGWTVSLPLAPPLLCRPCRIDNSYATRV